jgi:hypothetical protein
MWILVTLEEGSGESDKPYSNDDKEKGEPVVQVELSLEEYDAEQADEEDKGSTCHLIYRGCYEKQANVHQSRSRDVAAGGQGQ